MSIHRPLNGRKIFATGPTRNAQINVPIPRDPPRINPIATKEKSKMILVIPKFFFNFSATTMATKSLGPVPASDFITIVIPNAKMIHPRPLNKIFIGRDVTLVNGSAKIAVKISMIGPPKIIQRMVPIII